MNLLCVVQSIRLEIVQPGPDFTEKTSLVPLYAPAMRLRACSHQETPASSSQPGYLHGSRTMVIGDKRLIFPILIFWSGYFLGGMSRTSELMKLPGTVAAGLFSRKGLLEELEVR